MKEDVTKMWVGDKKVKNATVVEDAETPAGGALVDVEYEDGDKERITQTRFFAVRKYKKTDATKARDSLVDEAGRKVYALLMEYGPYLQEVDHILNHAVKLTNDATEEAMNILWGKKHAYERSLLDVNEVLRKKYEAEQASEKGNDGASPERSSADNADSEEGEVRESKDSD
jgi:hypothetical protein